MKAKFWILLLVMAGISMACNGRNASYEKSAEASGSYYDQKAETGQQPMAPQNMEDGGQSGEAEAAVLEKKIIRTANMRMEVNDYEEALAAVKGLIAAYEAELSSENEQQYGESLENQMVIKVAPQRFDSMLLALEQLAAHVDFKSVNAEDVTRQYIDLETRLASKRAVVERYRELLKQAKNVEEVLAVEENLRKVIEEIESVEGQLQYLSRQVDLSTVNLTIYEKGSRLSTGRSFWSRVSEGFENGWKLLKNLAVGLVTLWPIILILALLAFWYIRRRGKR